MSIFEEIIRTKGILLVNRPYKRKTGFLQSDYPEWVCVDSAIVKTPV